NAAAPCRRRQSLRTGLPQKVASGPECFVVQVLTQAAPLQKLLGLMETQVQRRLELAMSDLRLAVLLHEVDLLRLAVEVDALGAQLLLDIRWQLKADRHESLLRQFLPGPFVSGAFLCQVPCA